MAFEIVSYQTSLQLAQTNLQYKQKYGEKHQQNQNQLMLPDDLFVRFAYHLNENYTFTLLDDFFRETNDFKTKFLKELKLYYQYLKFNKETEQNNCLKSILTIVCNYQKFIHDIEPDREFTQQFQEYFIEKKTNINDLDPDKNDYFVISNIEVEWRLRIKNLDNYYNFVFAKNTKKTTKKSLVNRAIDMFKLKSLGYQESQSESQSESHSELSIVSFKNHISQQGNFENPSLSYSVSLSLPTPKPTSTYTYTSTSTPTSTPTSTSTSKSNVFSFFDYID